MRMRLRAPDEPEAESSYDGDGDVNSNSSTPSTPERSHLLPPLDVGSPEYIEERLENLKRRPNWGDFLDQYVQNHPDSESESEAGDFADVSRVDSPGFVRSTLWSLLVVAVAPLLILCGPCLRHKGDGFWPLGCRSMKELFSCAVANVISMLFGLVLLYWTICRDLPDVFQVDNTLVKLNVQIDEGLRAADTCHAALLQWDRAVAQELCMPVGIDVALMLLNTSLLLHCHRGWARYLMVLMAVLFVVDVPTKLYDATFPAPEIHQVDPTFALVDEELLVALDGKNLKHGGSVAWVAYWGCATTSNVDTCEKQFVSTFEAGNVAVAFTSLDHFIPCYRDPPNPLKAQDYQCFEHVRIRVKDKQSIPGWSRSAPQATSVSQSAKAEPTLSNEWQNNLEIPTFKREKESLPSRIGQNTIKPTHSQQRMASSTESIEAVEVDISASSSGYFTTETDGQSGLEKEAVELSVERSAQENESLSWSSQETELEPSVSEAADIDEGLNEVEVTPDAEVETFHINTEPETASQSEHTIQPAESSRESATETEELQDLSDSQVEVVPADVVEEPERTMGTSKVESGVLVNEGIRIIDEEIKLSTMTVVLEEGNLQTAPPDNQGERELKVEVERETETSTYEAQSEEASTSATIAQGEQKKLDSKQETSNPVDATVQAKETQSRPLDTTNDRTQSESSSKKRKGSKRKGQRKKTSGPANVDAAENAAIAE